ncbi:MAG: biotin/lipoyl-containing protein [Candidatus Thalassarchaeaceae archaeon]|jgi:biotin carboxyl carrier protein|nr:biotin/lipoyl-containing protein [Candidatus Thalassarchaeaceae archaeon]
MSEKRKITVDGEEFEVEVSRKGESWEISIGDKIYNVEIDEGERGVSRRSRATKSLGASGSGVISSAIPGKIVAIMTSEGDSVESGAVVIVLEAMKMQNEIKASIDGIVKSIMCKPGERVEANMPLMEITNSSEGEG